MAKQVTFTNVSVTTEVREDQARDRWTPDPYMTFKSHRATVGRREQNQRNTFSPSFDGPYNVPLGGPHDAEQVTIEVWDFDGRGADDLMEQALLDLGAEAASGTKTISMSRGGQVTLTWLLDGRPKPALQQLPPTEQPGEVPDERPGGSPRAARSTRLTIKHVSASSLPLLDGPRGVVDPYVLLTGKSRRVNERWDHQQNVASPVWSEPREVTYDPEGYTFEVWDHDSNRVNGDDLFGEAELKLEPTAAGTDRTVTASLRRGGSLQVAYSLTLGSAGQSPSGGSTVIPSRGPAVVVRKELRKMPAAEQQRFVMALKKIMENKNGPQTSEYYRLAGYHGWPSDFCQHGQETFPGWHRGYLCDLEQALIKADKELGNSGDIGLPYWDWSQLDVNGEVMPAIIRQHFADLPEGLVDMVQAGALGRRGYSQIRDDRRLRQEIESARVAFQAEQCLAVAEHWVHASTRFRGRGYSVESPHNSIHMCVGFPMTSLRYAAFHPIFFLHHCNVDRVYEKHIDMETPEESMQEFANQQHQLGRDGDRNRFQQALAPFMHPLNRGDPLMPADTFRTRDLGYVYDELPPTPAMQLREEPVFAAFKGVKVLDLDYKSYMLHVFVMPKGSGQQWSVPEGGPEAWPADALYAGCGAIFGGKGSDCCNCKVREPYNVLVEIQDALKKQSLKQYHEVDLRVMCEDEEGEVCALDATPVPPPVIVGPTFVSMQDNLAKVGPGQTADPEVTQLQGILQHLGYYPGGSSTDGLFGTVTDEAVKAFQKFVGLLEDGVVGPKTKEQLVAVRNDRISDVLPESSKTFNPPFIVGSVVQYFVGPLPGYLKKDVALEEIDEAFATWGAALGLTFARASSNVRARLQVQFADLSVIGERLDGLAKAGGQLAEATPQSVTLDASERWLLRGQAPPSHVKAFRLYPVLLHEIGHAIGLPHSSSRGDVMWPYYRPDIEAPRLSDIDKQRAETRVAAAGAERTDIPGTTKRVAPTCCVVT